MSVFDTTPTRSPGRERSVKLTWKLGNIVDRDGKPATAATVLYVAHDRGRKNFMAVAHRVDLNTDGPFAVEKFSGTGTRVRLTSIPCARFSAKALEAAAKAAVAELRARINEADVAALTDPNSPS